MAVRWAVSSSNWSDVNTWNDGATLGIPAAADEVWANGQSVTIDQSFTVDSLNNTARARDIATPAMTANNAPSPFVAAASGIFNASFDAWRAFNRNGSDGWAGLNNSPQWISMDFGNNNSVLIDGYTLILPNNTTNPRNWTFEGSNDNVNWTILHTVSGSGIVASYSVFSIGNITSYRYYRYNITLNNGGTQPNINEIELYRPNTAALASGGSFIFNSGSISGSATATTAALVAGATNLIQVTATTGSVTLNLSSNVSTGVATLINHSGNCDFNLNGQNFTSVSTAINVFCINKTSAGTINIFGNLIGGTGNNGHHTLNSTNGNTVVTGNVNGSIDRNGIGINQQAGNVTVIGNVTAQSGVGISLTGASSQFTVIGNVTGGTSTNAHGINFTGTSGSVTGTVTGGNGSNANGINSSGVITVTGDVNGGASSNANGVSTSGNLIVIGSTTAGSAPAINTASNISIDLTGTVTATAAAPGLTSTSTGTVLLTGNMLNTSGRQAIFAQNLFISNAATSQWRLFTQGGQDKTLYSADTFPNQPSAANVRSGSLYGPANALSGSMVVPVPSDVRVNVLTDNTVGTGQSLTAADFLAAISSSADPFAQRLRNVATVDTVGSLVTGLNGGF